MFPRESAEFIVKHAKNVSFKEEGIQKLSKMVIRYRVPSIYLCNTFLY